MIASARTLFASNGWAATGMRDVAAAAGVATETVYAHFSSKRGLLRAVIDFSVVGDDRPVALAERPEFAAIGRGHRVDRTRAAAHVLAAVHERTAPWAKLLREAAFHDDEIAEMLRATRERQRLDIAAGVELIMVARRRRSSATPCGRSPSPEVYLLLVEESGWTLRPVRGVGGRRVRPLCPTLVNTRRSAMATKSDAPADTTMMRIVHNALRRDLRRARSATGGRSHSARTRPAAGHRCPPDVDDAVPPQPSPVRGRGAVPVVACENSGGRRVLDAMEHQHEAIAAAITAVESSAAALAVDGSSGANDPDPARPRRARAGPAAAPAA